MDLRVNNGKGGAGVSEEAIEKMLEGKQNALPFVVLFAKISKDGIIKQGYGITGCNRASTGKYDLQFAHDLNTPDYSIFATTHGISSDPNTTITNETGAGCRVNIASGDNGGSADTPVDKDFSVIVLRSLV